MEGFAVWITGLSGSGKSTISRRLKDELEKLGLQVELVEGASFRRSLSEGLGFTKEDRKKHFERMCEVAKMLLRNRVVAIIAAVSPDREYRDRARAELKRFIEVYLRCPIEVAKDRDEIYARADRGEITNLAGVHFPYEEPKKPEVVCDTDREPPDKCVARIMKTLEILGYIAPPRPYAPEEEEQIKKYLKDLGYI
ncbi:MAG TPA: adenylyl-sulfate kinase [Proteobacteria bacterium]|nr:adenylyl-sulfate kinase [Pseudomonadota bacterium]